jgi:long-chain acyl-CoA synthetase
MTNLIATVGETVTDHPDEPAVVYQDATITYEQLWGQIGQFAAGLQAAGIEPGDRVAVYLPNLPQFVTSFHGTLRAGGVVVPMNPQYKSREIGHLLGDSGARVVVTLSDLVPFVEDVRDDTDVEAVVSVGGDAEGATEFEAFLGDEQPAVVDREDDDVAVQPYTSGTTGQPKGVLLTHENIASNSIFAAGMPTDGISPGDRMLGVLPLFHIYGMSVVMNATLYGGGAFYPLPEWDPEQAADLIEAAQLTLMHGVPAMYNDLTALADAESRDLASLRMAGVGGSGIPAEVLDTFEDLFDVTLYEGYGLTETSPITHFNNPTGTRRVGSIGQPIPDVDARVVDTDFEDVPPVERGPIDEDDVEIDEITGEIVVSGPNVMQGYHDRPGTNQAIFSDDEGQRWFHTGDVGYRDEDGYFYVVDREKHVIVTGGYNVYPREVEELLYEHDAVVDAAVVGIPDERRGETVKAFVVPMSAEAVGEDELREFVLERLAEYKHPREIDFVDELPRTTTGKVKKFELAEADTDE